MLGKIDCTRETGFSIFCESEKFKILKFQFLLRIECLSLNQFSPISSFSQHHQLLVGTQIKELKSEEALKVFATVYNTLLSKSYCVLADQKNQKVWGQKLLWMIYFEKFHGHFADIDFSREDENLQKIPNFWNASFFF